jgi:hypothetical protein
MFKTFQGRVNTIFHQIKNSVRKEKSNKNEKEIEKMSQENNQNEQQYYTEDGLVICQYCLKPFKMITKAHLDFHNMSMADYKNRFPNAPLRWKGFTYTKPSENINKLNPVVSAQPINNTVSWDTNTPLTKETAYLILKQKYPNIQKNYIFKKLNRDGQILFTFLVDFGDPSLRLLIDFEEMNWHARTPLFTKWRKKDLAGQSKWKYINFEDEFINMQEFIDKLK